LDGIPIGVYSKAANIAPKKERKLTGLSMFSTLAKASATIGTANLID